MKKTFEDESDALSTSPAQPTTAQNAAVTPPNHENQESTSTRVGGASASTDKTPVAVAGNGAPDYSQVELKTEPELPTPDKAGGSATEPESGGGYSG